MILLKKIYSVLLLWLFIIFGIFIFLFGTNFGTNLIFRGLVYYCMPGLIFDSVSGNWGNFNVTNVSYNTDLGMLNIDSIRISINLRYIFLKQINIEHVFLKNVFVETNEIFILNNNVNNNRIYRVSNIIKNLYPIFIKRIVLDSVNLVSNNVEFRFQKISFGLILSNNLLKVLPTYIVGGSVLNKFSISDMFNVSNILVIRNMLFSSQSSLNLETILKSIICNVLAVFTKYSVPIDLMFSDIQGEKFFIYSNCNYNNFYTIDHFQIQASWNRKEVCIKLKVDFPQGYFSSSGNITLDDFFSVNMYANYILHNTINYNCKRKSNIIDVKFLITGSLIDTISIRCDFFDIVSVIHILLKITLKDLALPVELFVTGKAVPLPVFRKNKYILEEFSLYLQGKLYSNYCIKIRSRIFVSKGNVACLSLCAQGNINNFTISELKLKFLEGFCKMQGVVNWNKTVSWNNTCVFNNINLFKKYLCYPIVLSGKIITQGCLSSDSWKLIVSDFCCYGNLKNNKIICRGSIYVGSNGELNIPMFFISWGINNRLEIYGGIQKNQIFNIVLRLKAVNCSDVLSKFNSDIIDGYCRVHGSVKSPELFLKININSLNWYNQDIKISKIVVTGDFIYKNSMKSNFHIKVDKIQYRDFLLCQLCIQGQGNLNEHNFNIIIYRDKEVLGIVNCIGKFDLKDQIWYGQISKTKICTPIGTWELMQDIVFIYQNISKKITVQSHHWRNIKCNAVISAGMQKDIFEKISSICNRNCSFIFSDIMPIEFINVYDINIYCTDIDWVVSNKYLPQGNIFLSSSKIDIKYANQQDMSVIVIDNIDVNIVLTKMDLFCCWIVNINENQNVVKFLVTDLYGIPKISGIVKIQNILLNSIFQFLLKSKPCIYGLFNIDINFKGYLNSPKVYGVLKLEHLNLNNPSMPFCIENGMLEITCLGNNAVLHGKINPKHDNQLCFDGKIVDINSICHICMLLNITGEQVYINISPIIYAKVSPNVVCSMTMEKIDLTGDIVISEAYITMQDFSKNVVEISSEEVILDEQHNPVLNKYKNFISVSSNFNLCLGDNVNFNGFGLHVKLQGNLEMICNQNDFTLIGPVNIFSGYVEMYGQNLMIKKGQLLFSGAINQTYIDIETIKNPVVFSYITDSVTAGMRITGLFNQLKLDFFSDSSLLSQQEIMLYLLGGGGHNSIFSDTNDTNMITSLLLGISMQRYEKLVDKVGEILGIQDLKLTTQNFGAPSLITLSGYIAPGIQVQYGISIVDLLKNTIAIRYCIHPQLYMEARSDNYNQSLDLLYRFSFN